MQTYNIYEHNELQDDRIEGLQARVNAIEESLRSQKNEVPMAEHIGERLKSLRSIPPYSENAGCLEELEREPKHELPLVLNWDTMRLLPTDVAEAVEQCKLAIIRHRSEDWYQVPCKTMTLVFEALARMTKQQTD